MHQLQTLELSSGQAMIKWLKHVTSVTEWRREVTEPLTNLFCVVFTVNALYFNWTNVYNGFCMLPKSIINIYNMIFMAPWREQSSVPEFLVELRMVKRWCGGCMDTSPALGLLLIPMPHILRLPFPVKTLTSITLIHNWNQCLVTDWRFSLSKRIILEYQPG